MNTILQDLRFTLRALVKRPTYTIITILVLALAIGANTTVFSVFNGLFISALPYEHGDRLVIVYNTYPRAGLDFAGTSIPDYLDRRDEVDALEDLGIYTSTRMTLGRDGTPESLLVVRASPSVFSVLGTGPAQGRLFTDDEAVIGNEHVVVLSHTLWQTRFGGRPDILGSDIHLNGQPYRVIGVMEDGFGFPNQNVRAWVPFAFTAEQMTDAERGNEFSNSIGRLQPGATIDGLNAQLDAIVQRNVERLGEAAAYVETTGFTGRSRPFRDFVVGDLRQMLLVLQASVFAVLLIACANIANLQLARVMGRRKELTVRAVLGAQRGRLATLVLAESLMLAAFGAVVGLMLAHGGLELVRWLGLDMADQGFGFALDGTVIAFTAGAALLAALIAGLVPVVVLLRDNLAQSINEVGRIGGGGRATQAFRNGLVVVQIAMSVALLVGAGLLTKSFYHLQERGPGFDPHYVLTASIALPEGRYPDEDARRSFYERALEELHAQPGISEAALVNSLPFSGNNWQSTLNIDGYTPPADTAQPHVQLRIINERYFDALDIPVIQGRNFAAQEADLVAIIDQNMARRYWPDGDAIGQRIRHPWFPEDDLHTIIGVVPPVNHGDLTEAPTKETVYWHYQQRPVEFSVFVLRTSVPPAQLTRLAGTTVAGIDPDLALFDVRPLDARVDESLGAQRTPMVLTLVFGVVAFTLAVIGIYGVLTWAVTQRFGEIGVRMALGAHRTDIIRLVVGQGGRMIAIGLGLGLLVAVALSHAMSAQIHGVSALDPLVFGVVIVGLVASALVASWIPARRAGRIHPMAALRNE